MEEQKTSRLQFFPITFFATVMGMAGLTIAWEKAQHVFQADLGLTVPLVGATTGLFVILVLVYLSKTLMYKDEVVKEFQHPVKLNFFPATSIGLLLLAICYLSINRDVSYYLWVAGAILHLAFTFYIVNAWMHHEHFKVQHINPAWFIPAVGNVLVPVAGVPLGFIDISWFFFSTGIMFWIVLFAIIFNRILFHEPIDARLLPTLFILIAPPAVGFISYIRLTGTMDSFAHVLYDAALFLTFLLLLQIPRFAKLQFFLSWWAYSFPLAAISIASMLMFEKSGNVLYQWIGGILLALLSVVVIYIVIRTIIAMARHELCLPGH
ncbi:MAG: SLAC1 anion channel family protein [Thiotrichales bacterium]